MARDVTHKPTRVRKGSKTKWRVYFAAGELAATSKLKEFMTQKDALEFVREFEARHEQLGHLASQTTTTELLQAKQASSVLSGSGLSVVDAARMAALKMESERKSETLGLGFERYMVDCERRRKSVKHLRDLKQTRNLFMPLLEQLLVNLSGEQIDATLLSLPPASRNLKIRHLKAVLNYCIKQDWLTSTPLKRVELAPIISKEIETYSAEQVRAIMDAVATNHLEAVPFFAISFFAGTRPEEIMKLEWSAFTDDGQLCITAAVNKTRTKRFTTVTPTLQAWLDWYEAQGGVREGRIFSRSQMTLIRIRRRVAEMAGVEWIQDGARKTFASAHYKIHHDALKTAYELGHRGTTMLHTHYNQNMRKEEAVRFWNILPS
jgi:integrase